MMFELWLSRRYLASGKREKIISLTACISMVGIALGVLVVIVVISVMSGFDKYLEDKMIGTNSHLLWEFYAGTNQPYALQEQLKQVPGVKASSPFIAGQAFIKTGVQVLGVEMRGIDPQLQPQVTKIDQYLTKGTLEVKDNEVVLGQELALNLGVGLGDTIRLISPATLKPQEFTVKGIFNSGMYLYDASLVLTDIKSAQRFFDAGDYVTGLAIKADDIYKVDAIKRSLYNKFYGEYEFEVRTWIDSNRNFLQALRLEKIVMFVVVTMTVVVAAFGIISTLIMSVMSKVRDIGILRAVGARARSILAIFLFQGLAIGVAGIAFGLVAGISLSRSLNKIVDFISLLIGKDLIPKDIYYFNTIPTSINAHDIGIIVACTLAIALLASFYPAFYATRINATDALRHE